ncbi:hypothetical protein ACHZ98_26410 [Streptomyces sp. MAR4 CNY-716]
MEPEIRRNRGHWLAIFLLASLVVALVTGILVAHIEESTAPAVLSAGGSFLTFYAVCFKTSDFLQGRND